jgi:hypothetical protein
VGDVSRPHAGGEKEQGPDPRKPHAAATTPPHVVGASATARPRVRHLSPASVQRLNRSAGNRAVAAMVRARAAGPAPAARATGGGGAGAGHAATTGTGASSSATAAVVTTGDAPVVQRYAGLGKGGGGSYAPPAPPKKPDPESDPKFTKVTKQLKDATKQNKAHPPGKGEAKKAADAAVPPGNDKEAQAKAGQADKMAGAKKGGFDKAAFVAAVKAAIAAKAPKNLDEADKFGDSGKAEQVKGEVMTKVASGKGEAAKDVDAKTKEPPDPSVAKDKPVTPLEQQEVKKPADPAFATAMPVKVPAEQTNFEGAKNEVDDQMKAADVSEKDLEKSNEPQMMGAVKEKKEGERVAREAPKEVRKKEEEVLKGAEQSAGKEGLSAMAKMFGGKQDAMAKAAGAKSDQKSKDEAKRAEVSTELNKIFDATKLDVEKILTDLDTKVDKAFSDGEARVRTAFRNQHKSEMQAFKDQRYSGAEGVLNWGYDLFNDLSEMPEVKAIYTRAVAKYEQGMEGVINDVATIVGTELDAAKARIAKGRSEITSWISKQPKDVQKLATDAAKQMDDRFKQLESDVDDKSKSLAEDLADKYTTALGEVNKEVEEAQAENRSAWSKAKAAIGESIEAILKLKALFEGILSKAISAFKKILADPLAFIGNFMSAVKAGFMNFANRIGEHLKNGLKSWLFGQLGEAGIEIPETLDLKGIIKMILSILGLTWASIRPKIVKRIGEKAMKALETASEVFVILVTQGVAGLAKWIADKVGDLKEMVLGQIRDFVIEKIVKAGITWVIGMLNPAGALIKIVQTLVSVIQWIMEKGGALVQLVSTIVDSVKDIADGGGGGVPAKIEGALAQAVPIVISFLASLLGLGGIGAKIKSILDAVRTPVGKAVDAVINGALKLAKPIIDAAKKLAKGAKDGMKKLGKKAKEKIKALLQPQSKPVPMAGAGHTLKFNPGSGITIASAEGSLEQKIHGRIAKLRSAPGDHEAEISMLKGILAQAKAAANLKKYDTAADPNKDVAAALSALGSAITAYAVKYKVHDFDEDIGPDDDIDKLLKEYGMPYMNFKHLQGVASSFRVAFEVRSTTKAAIKFLEAGSHKPKPEMIKAKTINDEDLFLGPFYKSNIGEVGFYKPKWGTKPVPDDRTDKVRARQSARAAEYAADKMHMDALVREGLIEIRNGLVKDKTSGKGFTGDHDLYQIFEPDGRDLAYRFNGQDGPGDPIAAKKADAMKKQIVSAAMAGGVQHGAHMDWKKIIGDDPRKNAIFMAIVNQHQGGQGLLRINPSGPPVAAKGG